MRNLCLSNRFFAKIKNIRSNNKKQTKQQHGAISSFRREVMRTALFWAIIMKMGPIRFPETSVSSYYFA